MGGCSPRPRIRYNGRLMSRAAAAFLVIASTLAAAGAASPWPGALPRLKLADPLGTEFTDEQLTARGAVFVVTAPTLSQGDTQQGWSAAFKDAPAGAVVFLQDMTQSYFRPIVISRMKSAYRPGVGSVLLLDETGATRKALGVGENATVVFAFTAGGKLAAVETAGPSAERAERLLRAARGER